ncbi:MAG: endoribonuclease [Firmicutes bacterium]|nr:endoribonuclease [Bacillota bacterium]
MKAIQTQKAPAAIGPYSQGIDLGHMVYTSGQIPVNPQTGEIPATIEEQTAQALNNAKAVLEAAGLSMDNVVKTLVFLSDLGEFAAMNEVYASFFQQPYPARSCVQVAAIPKGAKVEIECIAVR